MIEANFKLAKLNKASTLAVKLAKDAVFGEDVIRKCTPLGGRDLPGLPTEELFFLKKSIFDLFPTEWKNPEELEATWSNCIDSIGQACERIRAPKKQLTTNCVFPNYSFLLQSLKVLPILWGDIFISADNQDMQKDLMYP